SGTLTNGVAKKYGLCEIITADIIRHEVAKRSERALALARLISEGQLVPRSILVELIALKMLAQLSNNKGFIVSGFPRELSESELFDREIRPPDLVLYLNVRDSVLSDRIMSRSVKETERMSINFDHIKSMINDFHKRNKPIIKYYDQVLVMIDAEHDTLTVFEAVCQAIDPVLVNFPGFNIVIASTSNCTNASAQKNTNANVSSATNATTSKSDNTKVKK
ncbi:adenylate kinase isoenzyme 1-like, partial [Ceratina calcarata]|uniref:Adenylate kinase isoenzyme 1-like n=1 Tax=Ceratina calcarata TaxID=156304 RepID=A0AAJ7IS31_9HYME